MKIFKELTQFIIFFICIIMVVSVFYIPYSFAASKSDEILEEKSIDITKLNSKEISDLIKQTYLADNIPDDELLMTYIQNLSAEMNYYINKGDFIPFDATEIQKIAEIESVISQKNETIKSKNNTPSDDKQIIKYDMIIESLNYQILGFLVETEDWTKCWKESYDMYLGILKIPEPELTADSVEYQKYLTETRKNMPLYLYDTTAGVYTDIANLQKFQSEFFYPAAVSAQHQLNNIVCFPYGCVMIDVYESKFTIFFLNHGYKSIATNSYRNYFDFGDKGDIKIIDTDNERINISFGNGEKGYFDIETSILTINDIIYYPESY